MKIPMIPKYRVVSKVQILAETKDYNHELMNIPAMWKKTRGALSDGTGVPVVILDTGIPNHIDLKPSGGKSFIRGYHEDLNGHGCVSPDTLIHTNFCGVEMIQELYDKVDAPEQAWKSPDGSESIVKDVRGRGIKTYSLDEQTGEAVIALVEFLHKTPVSGTVRRVRLEGNIDYLLTPWHEVCLLKQRHHSVYDVRRKRADELVEGDRMIFAKGPNAGNLVFDYFRTLGSKYRKCKSCGHISNNYKPRSSRCQCKKCGKSKWEELTRQHLVTEDLAYLAGLVVTDGHVVCGRNYRVEISGIEIDVLNGALVASNRLGFGGKLDYPKDRCPRLLIDSKELVTTFVNLGVLLKDKTCSQSLPEFVGKSPYSVVCAFVAGVIDGDGCISKSNTKNRVTGVSSDFAYRLSALLNSMGVSCGVQSYGESKGFDLEEGRGVDVLNCTFSAVPVDVSRFMNHPERKKRAQIETQYKRKARRVMEVSEEQYDGFFYDFTVKDHHTYLGNGHFVSNTHVGGIIAATANNGMGVAGIAPECADYYGAVLGKNGSGEIQSIIDGIHWAVDEIGARIISMSLGIPAGTRHFSKLEEAVNYATSHGVAVICAAGNEAGAVGQPASYKSSIAVAAVNGKKQHARFSDSGPEVDFAAGGVNVYSTYLKNGYAKLSGTCIAKGTYIYTPSGPRKIEEIQIGDEVWAYKDGDVVSRKVSNVLYQGRNTVKHIRALGRDVWATKTHRFLTFNELLKEIEWVELDNLSEDHRLMVPVKFDCVSNPYLDRIIPEDFAWLLGFFLRDGWLTSTERSMRVNFANVDKDDVLKKVYDIYEKYTGKMLKSDKTGSWSYDDSTRLAAVIETFGLNSKAKDKSIPLWLWSVSDETRMAFYRGYIAADGHDANSDIYRNERKTFECASYDLIRRMAILSDYNGWQHSVVRRRDRMIQAPSSHGPSMKTSFSLSVGEGKPCGGFNSLRTSTTVDGKTVQVKGEDNAGKFGIDSSRFVLAKWKIDEQEREADVYDLTVPDADCFIAHGLVVHNSMACPALAGVATLILADEKNGTGNWLTPAQLVEKLKLIAFDVGNDGFDEDFGYGIPVFRRNAEPPVEPPEPPVEPPRPPSPPVEPPKPPEPPVEPPKPPEPPRTPAGDKSPCGGDLSSLRLGVRAMSREMDAGKTTSEALVSGLRAAANLIERGVREQTSDV